MTKDEAVRQMVERDFAGVPQEWVKIVMEHENEYANLPMWGTMFIVDSFYRSRLKTRVLVEDKEEINLDDYEGEERARIEKAIAEDDDTVLEDYIDEEMAGAECILDKDGDTTAAFIYDVGGRDVIGVNGAGWDFYDGVWNNIYDAVGLQWHDETTNNK